MKKRKDFVTYVAQIQVGGYARTTRFGFRFSISSGSFFWKVCGSGHLPSVSGGHLLSTCAPVSHSACHRHDRFRVSSFLETSVASRPERSRVWIAVGLMGLISRGKSHGSIRASRPSAPDLSRIPYLWTVSHAPWVAKVGGNSYLCAQTRVHRSRVASRSKHSLERWCWTRSARPGSSSAASARHPEQKVCESRLFRVDTRVDTRDSRDGGAQARSLRALSASATASWHIVSVAYTAFFDVGVPEEIPRRERAREKRSCGLGRERRKAQRVAFTPESETVVENETHSLYV